jgi:outer membrane protein insertion porin family
MPISMPLRFIAFVLLLSGAAFAQGTRPHNAASDSRLVEIRVLGSKRFPQKDLIAATGLRLGDAGTEAALKKAADRLAASGMFSDVTYRYTGSPQGIQAEFQVNDTAKLLPAHFDNFVWLSNEELLNRLHDREPLFVGKIPNVGDMYQRLAEDLKLVLEQLHVTAARVRVFPEAALGGREVIGFKYLVEGVELPIRNVIFEGDSAPMEPLLQHAAAIWLVRTDYSETNVKAIAKYDFLPLYRSRGYLRAEFSSPSATLLDPEHPAVSVKLPVQEGIIYQLAAVQWSGNAAYTTEVLERVLKPEFGAPLDQVALEERLGGISKIYGTKGYMVAGLKPEYVFDDPAQKVKVHVQVTEGAQFHVGTVRFEGLDAGATAFMERNWQLHPGDVYDSSYSSVFLTTISRQVDLTVFKIESQQKLNPIPKTVDLTLRFSPK